MSQRSTRSSSKNRSLPSDSDNDKNEVKQEEVNECNSNNVNNSNRKKVLKRKMQRKAEGSTNSKKTKANNGLVNKVKSVVKKITKFGRTNRLKQAAKTNDTESDQEQSEDCDQNTSKNETNDEDHHEFKENGKVIKMQVNADEDDFESDNDDETDHKNENNQSLLEQGSDSDSAMNTSASQSDYSEGEIVSPSKSSKANRLHKKKGKRHRRHQMAKQIDDLSNAVFTMQNVMAQKGIIDSSKEGKDQRIVKERSSNEGENSSVDRQTSLTTIYEKAVDKVGGNEVNVDADIILNLTRSKQAVLNSSSDEPADTSDELINVTDQFIADCAAEVERRRSLESNRGERRDNMQPGSSHGRPKQNELNDNVCFAQQ